MRSLYSLAAGAVLLCLSACYRDKGNYDYHPINDIAIETADTTIVNYGDTLHIDPVLHQQLDSNESDLQFEWSVLVSSASLDSSFQLLATTRNLDIPVAIPSQSAYYPLYYRVRNAKTNITYTKIIRLMVTSNFQTGWLAMEQNSVHTDISFINTVQHQVYHHAYSAANPDKLLPLHAAGIFNLNIPAYQSSYGTVHKSSLTAALLTDGGYVLDVRSMKVAADYAQLFTSAPPVTAPAYLSLDPNAESITINDGKLYRRVMSQENTFAAPFTTSDGSGYHLAPMDANTSNVTTMYFDVLNHRFLKEVFKTRLLQPFTTYDWASFDPNNVPETPLALGVGYYKYYQYGIFQKTSNDGCLLYSYSQGNPLDRVEMNAPGVMSSKAFVFSTIRYQLYYGAANQLYLYDIQANNAAPVYTFPDGETVTAMKAVGTTGIVVATYNGSEGFVYLMTFADTGEINDLFTSRYGGFDRIISLSYKE